jgi:hypothetical protein
MGKEDIPTPPLPPNLSALPFTFTEQGWHTAKDPL